MKRLLKKGRFFFADFAGLIYKSLPEVPGCGKQLEHPYIPDIPFDHPRHLLLVITAGTV